MLSTFLRRRIRRLTAYTVVFGFAILFMAYRESELELWFTVLSGFEFALAEDGGNATFEALKYFALVDLAPFLIVVSVIALISFIIAFIAVAIATTVVPLRFQSYLDGIAAMLGLIMIFEGTGLSDPVRETFGNVGTVVFYWAVLISTSAPVWNRLPFGFRYQNTASRKVPLAIDAIADRLIPLRAPDEELADISLLNRQPQDEEEQVHIRMAPHQTEGSLTFDIYQEGVGQFVKTQNMKFELFETAPEATTLNVTVTLTGLSPLSYWDFWNRPFTEDYADHLIARLTHSKDRSTYGRMQSAMRIKQDKNRLRQAPA